MSAPNLPLQTERVRLRTFERADLDALCAYHSLPSVQRYTEVPSRDTKEVAGALEVMRRQVSLQRPGDTIALAIVRIGDGQLLGQACLRWSDATAGQAEIRFILNPQFTGHGYADEALRAVFDMAFEHYKIHRIFARCDGGNPRSAKLLQRLGMRLEAHYREHALFQGEWDEELHFAILNREWGRSSKVKVFPQQPRVA